LRETLSEAADTFMTNAHNSYTSLKLSHVFGQMADALTPQKPAPVEPELEGMSGIGAGAEQPLFGEQSDDSEPIQPQTAEAE
jgi:hypothetical protein